jgi:DnaJ homolog subfamily B member 12
VFNFGGGPNFRVHQFGGGRPRRRPREANDGQEQAGSTIQTIMSLLPIFLLFIFPLLSSLFSGGSHSSTPGMVFDTPDGPYTLGRKTPITNVKYFVNPADVASYSKYKLNVLDDKAEIYLQQSLRYQCENEMAERQKLVDEATGWFRQDPEKMRVAKRYEMPSCHRMKTLGVSR